MTTVPRSEKSAQGSGLPCCMPRVFLVVRVQHHGRCTPHASVCNTGREGCRKGRRRSGSARDPHAAGPGDLQEAQGQAEGGVRQNLQLLSRGAPSLQLTWAVKFERLGSLLENLVVRGVLLPASSRWSTSRTLANRTALSFFTHVVLSHGGSSAQWGLVALFAKTAGTAAP